ncbi:MAG: SDR family NAD(P)-dependent oxidoreductase [Clostridiales bacterium]|nr:SDR family NAD(P)-dependent oxidoreductase [Clostridiales bacterium]
MGFREKYGEWAFVAGGSEGMGGAFCDRLAKEGMHVVVTGRHGDKIENKCRQLESDFGVQTKALVIDLGELDVLDQVKAATDGLEIGFLVYNAGLASMSLFPDRDIDFELYRLNVNVRSQLALSLWFSKGMNERKKGGIILLSSVGGIVGSPYIQTYSATKAYNFTLAEALWGELSDLGIDVMAVLPGNTIGQNFSEVPAGTPGFQTGAEVVEEAFVHFGKEPAFIAGQHNRDLLGNMFPIEMRKQAIVLMKQQLEATMAQFGTGEDKR